MILKIWSSEGLFKPHNSVLKKFYNPHLNCNTAKSMLILRLPNSETSLGGSHTDPSLTQLPVGLTCLGGFGVIGETFRRGAIMKSYLKPSILHLDLELNSIQTQGTQIPPTETPPPDNGGTPLIPLNCAIISTSCSNQGVPHECFNSQLVINFLLETSSSEPPANCVVTYDGKEYTNCSTPNSYAVCPEGHYWQTICDSVPCTTNNPISIQCDGTTQTDTCQNMILF